MTSQIVSGDSTVSQRHSARGVWFGALILVLLGVAAYSNSFTVPFLFDDFASIPENETIRKLWPLTQNFRRYEHGATVAGRPVINFSLALNYAIGELDVRGYHAFNLAVHLLAGLTLFGLIRRTLLLPKFPERISSRATGLALTCALLWTLHPLQTESVTYIIQRAESLAGLFYLLILYCVVRSVETRPETLKAIRLPENCRESETRTSETITSGSIPTSTAPNKTSHDVDTEGRSQSLAWTVAAILCCLFGVGCKEVLVTAPVVVLLYDRFFLSNSFAAALTRRRWLYAGFGVAWMVQGFFVYLAGNRGGSAGIGVGITPWQYLGAQFGAVLHYLRLSVWPDPLVFDYGKYLPLKPAAILIPGFILSGIGLFFFLIARRQSWVAFVVLAGGLILAPSSSIIPIATQVMTEHRMYLPLAAVVILVVFGFDSLCDRRSRVRESAHSGSTDSSRWHSLQIARITIATGLVLLCTYRTYARNYDYRSAIAIWEDTAAKVPWNARARNNYGNVLIAADRPHEALREFEAAINLRQQDCDPYFNRSLIEEKNGDLQKAVLDMAEAVRYCPLSEYYVVRRATLLMKTGDPEQAALEFSRALKLAPGSTLYHYERGNCYMELGKYKDAIRDFTQVVIGEPDAYRAWHNRGNMYAKLGQLEESIRDLSQAITLRPDLPEQYANRAASYYENRQYDLAWADVEQCRRRGGTVDPELLRLLEERAPRTTSRKQ